MGICYSGFTLGAGLGFVVPGRYPQTKKSSFQMVCGYRFPALVVIDQSADEVNENAVIGNETVSEIDYNLIKTQMRSLHLGLTGLSIVVLLGFAMLYTKDPIPPNVAERQRTQIGFENLLRAGP